MYGIDNNTVFFLRGDSYKDLSANNRAMTNYGSVIGGETSGKFGPGINFRGSRLTVANGTAGINWAGDFTVEWWECVYGSMTDPASGSLFYNRIATGSNFSGVLIGYIGTKIYTGNNTASWNGFSSTDSKSLTTNTWVHWAFVKQGTTWKSYRNGALYWSATNTVVPSACDNGLSIGAWYDGGTHANYNATICEYRVSNVARYNENFTPQTEPYSSIQIANPQKSGNNIVFELSKTPSETASKIDILTNGSIVKTQTTWSDSITMSLSSLNLTKAINDVEIRVYYFGNYYEKKSIKIFNDGSFVEAAKPDGIDSNTMLCLRGDSYIDLSPRSCTITNVNTNMVATGGKFGGKGINPVNGYMYSHNFFTGFDWSKDLTIEWWEFPVASFDKGAIFQNRSTTTTANTQLGLLVAYHGNTIWTGSATIWNGMNSVTSKDVTLNTWTHWAYVKQGSAWRSYKNGQLYWSATNAVVPNACDNGLTIGAWVSSASYDHGYNAIINDYCISNVARYSANFTPRQNPMTSVGVSNILFKDNLIACTLTKSSNETVSKIELLINGSPVKTYTTWTDSVELEIADNEVFMYGSNSIEVRAYYYNDYYVSKNLTITRTMDKLTNSATFEDVTNRFERIRLENEMITNTLARILASKGIAAGDNPKMSYLVTLVGQMSGAGSSDTTEYLNQISTLTSQVNNLTTEIENNKLALVNALMAKNIECSINEEYSSLIEKISLFNTVALKKYLYKEGDLCSSVTGGYRYSTAGTAADNAGYTKLAPIINTDNIEIKDTSTSIYGFGAITPVNKIDLSSYSSLIVDATVLSANLQGYSSCQLEAIIYSTEPDLTKWNYSNIGTRVTDAAASSATSGRRQMKLDISNLSGSYYILVRMISLYSAVQTRSERIHNIWLE